MPFIAPDTLARTEIFPGVMSGLVAGEHVMLSFVEIPDGHIVPEHSHPEEQAGLMLEGEMRLRIGEEEKLLTPGEAFIVPPNALHSVEVVKGPVRALDVFGPPRRDYLKLMP